MSPPHVSGPNGMLENEPLNGNLNNQNESKMPEKEFKTEIVWKNVMIFVFLHLGAFYGLYLSVFYAQWTTILIGKHVRINLKIIIIIKQRVCIFSFSARLNMHLESQSPAKQLTLAAPVCKTKFCPYGFNYKLKGLDIYFFLYLHHTAK